MKDYLIYKCRRKALGLSEDDLASKCGIDKVLIIDFESGKYIPKEDKDVIKSFIRQAFCDMRSIDHYKSRIMELAMEIYETETNFDDQINCISHMMIELGKLQGELNGVHPRRAYEWKKMAK